jgi:calmodulin
MSDQKVKEPKLGEDELAEVKEAFSMFDLSGKNKVSGEKLGDVLRALGHDPTPSEVLDLVNELGKTIKDEVEYDEFLMLYERKQPQLASNHGLRVAFRMFDKEEKGYIVPSDVVETMNQLHSPVSIEQATELIKSSSLYGYSRINFEEFVVSSLF